MRPGLGKILPRMRRGIGADEFLLPVRHHAIGVIGLQRLAVIHRLVAKNLAARFGEAAIAHQHVPKIMADLMAEVPEQRAIWLVHWGAALLALDVICLLERPPGPAHCMTRP